MEIRFAASPRETEGMNTEALRNQYLIAPLMIKNTQQLYYSHGDRMIVGGVCVSEKNISLACPDELKAAFFLERREMGIVNLGGHGTVVADGIAYPLQSLDALYLRKGIREVNFLCTEADHPACFYLVSAPAHQTYPVKLIKKSEATPVQLGSAATSNARTIFKYIHPEGAASCQLVMGLTVLEPGSVWNSVPPHTHTRRSEIYCYFNLEPEHRVFHFMGEPQQSRHIVVGNHEGVISPPWSMHFGVGTSNYGFVWAMAGENQTFSDMDQVAVNQIL